MTRKRRYEVAYDVVYGHYQLWVLYEDGSRYPTTDRSLDLESVEAISSRLNHQLRGDGHYLAASATTSAARGTQPA